MEAEAAQVELEAGWLDCLRSCLHAIVGGLVDSVQVQSAKSFNQLQESAEGDRAATPSESR